MQNDPSHMIERLKTLGSRAGRDVQLPVTDSFLLEMADDETLMIKGCRGIAGYAPERIALLTDKFLIAVSGTNLYLRRYSDTDAAVGGTITSVSFGRDAC